MTDFVEKVEYPVPTYLAELHPHPRDKDISFEEGPHIYTVLGDRGGYTSVTTWNHHHFEKFDSNKIITNILLDLPKRLTIQSPEIQTLDLFHKLVNY